MEIGNYQLLEKIGEGAFGETWLAQSHDNQENQWDTQHVVIKKLKIDHTNRWKTVERFQREAALMKQLDHPGIPQYIDFIEEKDFIGIVQEQITGLTLENMVKTRPAELTTYRIESILRQGLEILDYLELFSPPIIHRDISPKNMILNHDNRLYLIDFGTVQKSYSDTVTCMGTFGYMAPEQLKGKATTQSDLFSFGMVILTLITQKPVETFPVDAKTGKIRVDLLLRGYSKSIKKVISGMIEPGTGRRFRSARQALKELNTSKSSNTIIKELKQYTLPDNTLHLYWITAETPDPEQFITQESFRLPLRPLFKILISVILVILTIILNQYFPIEIIIIALLLIFLMFFTPIMANLMVKDKKVFRQNILQITHNSIILLKDHHQIKKWDIAPVVELDHRFESRYHLNIVVEGTPYLIKILDDLESAIAFKKKLTDQIQALFPDQTVKVERSYSRS